MSLQLWQLWHNHIAVETSFQKRPDELNWLFVILGKRHGRQIVDNITLWKTHRCAWVFYSPFQKGVWMWQQKEPMYWTQVLLSKHEKSLWPTWKDNTVHLAWHSWLCHICCDCILHRNDFSSWHQPALIVEESPSPIWYFTNVLQGKTCFVLAVWFQDIQVMPCRNTTRDKRLSQKKVIWHNLCYKCDWTSHKEISVTLRVDRAWENEGREGQGVLTMVFQSMKSANNCKLAKLRRTMAVCISDEWPEPVALIGK